MKKFLSLLFGLLVAGLAAWAVPREHKATPVQIEIKTFIPTPIQADVIQIDSESTQMDIVNRSYDVGKIAKIQYEIMRDIEVSKFRWRMNLIYLNSNTEAIYKQMRQEKNILLTLNGYRNPRSNL